MNSKILIENQYFGCIYYYLSLFKYSNIEIESCEWYQKMSFRNRCILYGSNGLITLSVPLEDGRNQRRLIKDVKIDYSAPWHQRHWKSIQSVYGKSPFFEYYASPLKGLLEKKQIFLFDLNTEIFHWLKKILKIEGEISFSETYQKDVLAGVVDYRNKWLPKNFQEEKSRFNYPQPFEEHLGFQHNLSILDFLFNEGPYLSALRDS